MPRFVVYEILTRHRIIEAATEADALNEHEPLAVPGLSVCNWYAVEIPESTTKPILGLVQKGER